MEFKAEFKWLGTARTEKASSSWSAFRVECSLLPASARSQLSAGAKYPCLERAPRAEITKATAQGEDCRGNHPLHRSMLFVYIHLATFRSGSANLLDTRRSPMGRVVRGAVGLGGDLPSTFVLDQPEPDG